MNRFRKAHNWVDDYALFMALKDSYNGLAWTQWPSAIRKRERHALESPAGITVEVDFYVFLQLLFYTQWKKLAAYARAHNVKIIGDIPIYVALDSADAWVNPELFLLDEEDRPVLVAGCPPDAFTADGQLWGNPLYRWDLMQETGFQ
ncbi:MAG: 4-alpha-glucanotransferase [Acutalibacteraceae bacterium]